MVVSVDVPLPDDAMADPFDRAEEAGDRGFDRVAAYDLVVVGVAKQAVLGQMGGERLRVHSIDVREHLGGRAHWSPRHGRAEIIRSLRGLVVRPLPDAFTAYGWALSTAEAAPGRRSRDARGASLRREHAAAASRVCERTDDRGRARRDSALPARRLPGAARVRSRSTRASNRTDHRPRRRGGRPAACSAVERSPGQGDVVRVVDEPTYPVLRMAAWLAGADVGDDDPVLTFCCRPHNPTRRPLRARFPTRGRSSWTRRTSSSAATQRSDATASSCDPDVLEGVRARPQLVSATPSPTPTRRTRLRVRQDPLPITTLSAALALAALRAGPPDVAPTIAEREWLDGRLRELGLEPLPSHANFLYVPMPGARGSYDRLLRRGLVVRPSDDAIRITVHTRDANERLLEALR